MIGEREAWAVGVLLIAMAAGLLVEFICYPRRKRRNK